MKFGVATMTPSMDGSARTVATSVVTRTVCPLVAAWVATASARVISKSQATARRTSGKVTSWVACDPPIVPQPINPTESVRFSLMSLSNSSQGWFARYTVLASNESSEVSMGT